VGASAKCEVSAVTTPFRIISGGQTGVDRAALDVALELGIPCGGWCPKGRRAEDGRIADRYPLRETPRRDYRQRTALNVESSDATLLIYSSVHPIDPGTTLTERLVQAQSKGCFRMAVELGVDPTAVRQWIDACGTRVLNVAGPRESSAPGIYAAAVDFLRRVAWPK
jgi:hypothetical protein